MEIQIFLFLKILIIKIASSGFFINRTVFAIFLLFSLISSLELLKNLDTTINKKRDNFFFKIYLRLFIVFITIGIITSFSRIGNFLLLTTILCYVINEFFVNKNNNKSFKYVILLIIFFDILLMGFYFGSFQIIDRFYFLKEEFSEISNTEVNLGRFQIAQFGLKQLNNFLLFGYGAGGFEKLFQLNFINSSNFYANHAHSDIVEFIGEFGLIGLILIIVFLSGFFLNKKSYSFTNLILMFYLIIILFFDFSLHVPVIQMLFVIFFNLNIKRILILMVLLCKFVFHCLLLDYKI